MLILFGTIALVHLVALMSPGPDFFFVSQTAASRSRKEAMLGVLGITLAVMIWAAVALMGLHLILQKWPGCIKSSWSVAGFTCYGWDGS